MKRCMVATVLGLVLQMTAFGGAVCRIENRFPFENAVDFLVNAKNISDCAFTDDDYLSIETKFQGTKEDGVKPIDIRISREDFAPAGEAGWFRLHVDYAKTDVVKMKPRFRENGLLLSLSLRRLRNGKAEVVIAHGMTSLANSTATVFDPQADGCRVVKAEKAMAKRLPCFVSPTAWGADPTSKAAKVYLEELADGKVVSENLLTTVTGANLVSSSATCTKGQLCPGFFLPQEVERAGLALCRESVFRLKMVTTGEKPVTKSIDFKFPNAAYRAKFDPKNGWSAALFPWVRGVHFERDLVGFDPKSAQAKAYAVEVWSYPSAGARLDGEKGTLICATNLVDKKLWAVRKDGSAVFMLDLDLYGKVAPEFRNQWSVKGCFRLLLKSAGKTSPVTIDEDVTYNTFVHGFDNSGFGSNGADTWPWFCTEKDQMLPIYVSATDFGKHPLGEVKLIGHDELGEDRMVVLTTPTNRTVSFWDIPGLAPVADQRKTRFNRLRLLRTKWVGAGVFASFQFDPTVKKWPVGNGVWASRDGDRLIVGGRGEVWSYPGEYGETPPWAAFGDKIKAVKCAMGVTKLVRDGKIPGLKMDKIKINGMDAKQFGALAAVIEK